MGSADGAGTAKPAGEIALREELEVLRRRNSELEVLYDTIRDLTSTLSVREVLQRLLDRTLAHLESEIASILLMRPDRRLRLEVARGLPEEVVAETAIQIGRGISGYVAKTAQPLLVADVETDSRFSRRNHERYYTHSFISAPIISHDRVAGVINVNNKRSRRSFDKADLRLLEALAGHASAALGNACLYEEMQNRAQRDALTGLANHGYFWSSLEREVSRSRRYGGALGLAMIDVDDFKAFNDRHGHQGGDQALVAVSDVLAKTSRATDLVARYGGEEFAVILPETSLEGAARFGEKVRETIANLEFGDEDGDELTVSVGISVTPGSSCSAEELVRTADSRRYRGKAMGRNCVCADDGEDGGSDARF